jgi:ribosomal protein RSM22 (predicted rRNA methylase)
LELPAALRAALDAALEGVPAAARASASERLSRRYRAELRDGRLHIGDEAAALGYCAARLPATFAAVRASLARVGEAMPDFAPQTLLDLGSGPGTAMWAAAECWPSLRRADLLEASRPIRDFGRKLGCPPSVADVRWHDADLAKGLSGFERADLVTVSYVLDELDPPARDRLSDAAWAAAKSVLLVVEPGTPAGWRRILALRERLLRQGASIAAPCPHGLACPLEAPDWCHFARRLPRSRSHRLAKAGSVPWEDEKFLFLAASRGAARPPAARVLAPPAGGSGQVRLKLCRSDGSLERLLVTRRDGQRFSRARRLEWGDGIEKQETEAE